MLKGVRKAMAFRYHFPYSLFPDVGSSLWRDIVRGKDLISKHKISSKQPHFKWNQSPLMFWLYMSPSSTVLHVKGELDFKIVHTNMTSNQLHVLDPSFLVKAMPDFMSARSLVLACFPIHLFMLQSQYLFPPFFYQGRSLKTWATIYAIVPS